MKFSITGLTNSKGEDSWGIVIGTFETQKEAKAFMKDLKKIIEDYIRK